MSSPNLLITGVTGFIGFKVLLDALKEGYSVRAVVRSISQSKILSSHPKVKALSPGDKLSFFEVPDLSRAGAYDEAIKGVTYIIHLASPLPNPALDPQTEIYEPTIRGLTSLLDSAVKVPSIKRIVLTASVLGNTSFPLANEINADTRVPNMDPPFPGMIPAYCAAKIAALNATDKFVKDNKPSFSVVNIFPGFVFGYDDKALEAKDMFNSTNGLLLPILLGNNFDDPRLGFAAHVHDVAKVHLLALKEEVSGNLGVTLPVTYDDAWEIAKKHFPKAVEDGTFTKGSCPTVPVNWNASKTEELFGFKFKSYEDIVVDVAGQYLELLGKEKA